MRKLPNEDETGYKGIVQNVDIYFLTITISIMASTSVCSLR